jgi:hypothetical protein
MQLTQTRIQVRIVPPITVRASIEAMRMKWNPERAKISPAHITIAYHDEATDVGLVVERLRSIAKGTPAFELVLGRVSRFVQPIRGAYVEVDDPTDSVAAVRRSLLAHPFATRNRFGLHMTVLHPDQGERLEDAWPELASHSGGGRFMVTQFEVIGSHDQLLITIPLG